MNQHTTQAEGILSLAKEVLKIESAAVSALSDRIGIMKSGKLLAVGTVEELNALAGTNDFETAFVSIVKEDTVV